MKLQIVSTHIENDLAKNLPTLIYTDANGIEWVQQSGGIYLEQKSKSWYFREENKKK